jgi:soluble cytochrome b562
MKLEDQVKQLTELMSELIPTVDRLVETQKKGNLEISEISEMRASNMRLAEAIENLIVKIDKIDQFEERLVKIERALFKQ